MFYLKEASNKIDDGILIREDKVYEKKIKDLLQSDVK